MLTKRNYKKKKKKHTHPRKNWRKERETLVLAFLLKRFVLNEKIVNEEGSIYWDRFSPDFGLKMQAFFTKKLQTMSWAARQRRQVPR